jgi:EmrB/QacA subfamily drug resistance transporter
MSEPHPRRWLILIAMALTMFIATVDNTVMTVGLPAIQEELNASTAQLQWSLDAYTLLFASLLFTAGLLGDRFGRRRVLLGGLCLFLLASLAGAWSSTPGELIAARALMGVGAAVIPGCTLAVIVSVFGADERVKAIGLWSVAAGVGVALGPIIGGALVSQFWWGSLLLVNVPFLAVAMAMIARHVPENAGSARRFDLVGVLLTIAGVGSLVYGIIVGGEDAKWLTLGVLGPIVLGLVLICTLVLFERRTKFPSVDVDLFTKPRFAIGAATTSVAFFVGAGGTFVLSLFLQQLRGYTAIETGLLLLPLAVGSMYAGARSGQLVERLGGARALCLCGMATALGAASLALTDGGTSLVVVEITLAVLGLGFGGAFALGMALAVSAVPPERLGAGSALANTVRHMGTALGIAVLGSVLASSYQSAMSGSGLPQEATTSLGATAQAAAALPDGSRAQILDAAQVAFVDGFQAAMWLGAGLSLAAGLIALVVLRTRPVPEPAAAVS